MLEEKEGGGWDSSLYALTPHYGVYLLTPYI